MSKDKPPSRDDQPPRSDESPSEALTQTSLPSVAAIVPDVVEQKLEEVVRDLPESKQREVKTTIHEFMALVERGVGPRIDAETAKILTASADKDNEFRFKYLSQKQKDTAEQIAREHELETTKHRDRVRIFWPILITVLPTTVGCLVVGIYLAATGHDILGTGLITGTAFAVAGYLAGCGTANFFKTD
jgi:hypothetical protein